MSAKSGLIRLKPRWRSGVYMRVRGQRGDMTRRTALLVTAIAVVPMIPLDLYVLVNGH